MMMDDMNMNTNTSSMDDTMLMDDMDDNMNGMTMTFGSWKAYKIKVLFSSWNVQTEWEFALTWFAVAFFVIIFHGMRYFIYVIEDFMHTPSKPVGFDSRDKVAYQTAATDESDHNLGSSLGSRGGTVQEDDTLKYILLRVLHSVLSGLNYGLSLLLMLVAMTYNPSLLMALIVGYAVGDFVFYARMRPSSITECH